jgi:NADPH2:quinone reductase
LKAAWFESFGNARDVIRQGALETPEPGNGEVLVKLETSGVNPSDVKKRAGSMPELLDDGPVIPHSDGAGVVAAVGAGVTSLSPGQRVWVYQAQHGRPDGTAAEFVCLEERRVVPLPDQASFEAGACLGIPAMTAHRCVFADGPVSEKSVLITGGAGRVGHYAIQWARAAGARVVATASNAADEAACLQAGARAVVNHREANWSGNAIEANDGRKFDRVVDVEFGSNLEQVLNLIKVSGTIATYSSSQDMQPVIPFYRMMFMDLTIRLVIVYDMPERAKREAISDITEALEANRLNHRVARVYPFAEIAAAHGLIEQGGVRGCVLLNTAP